MIYTELQNKFSIFQHKYISSQDVLVAAKLQKKESRHLEMSQIIPTRAPCKAISENSRFFLFFFFYHRQIKKKKNPLQSHDVRAVTPQPEAGEPVPAVLHPTCCIVKVCPWFS